MGQAIAMNSITRLSAVHKRNQDYAHRNIRALVVEDDPFSQKLFEHIIESCGPTTEVTLAGDFESAMNEFLKNSHFDLFIIDLFLGTGKTGLDFYDAILKFNARAHVIMTSVLDRARFESVLGRNRALPTFLQKPFHPEVCKTLIENLLKEVVHE